MPNNLPAITATSDELIVWIEYYAGAQNGNQLAPAVQEAHDRQERNLAYYRAQYGFNTVESYESNEEEHTHHTHSDFDKVTLQQDLTTFLNYYGISVDIVDRVGITAAARLAAKSEFAAAMRLVHNHNADVDRVAFGAVLAGEHKMAWQLHRNYGADLTDMAYGAGWTNDAKLIKELLKRCSNEKVKWIYTGAIQGAAFMGHDQLVANLWQRHPIDRDSVAKERVEAGDLSAINSDQNTQHVRNVGLGALGDLQLIKLMGRLDATNNFEIIIHDAALSGRYALIHDLLKHVTEHSQDRHLKDLSCKHLCAVYLALGGNLNQILYLLDYKKEAPDIAWQLNIFSNWRLLNKLSQWCGQNYRAHRGIARPTMNMILGKENPKENPPEIINQLATDSERRFCYVNGFQQIAHFFGIVNDQVLRQRFLDRHPQHKISWFKRMTHGLKQCFSPDNTALYQHPFSDAQLQQVQMIDRLHMNYGLSTEEALFWCDTRGDKLWVVDWFQCLYKPLSEGRYDHKHKLFTHGKEPLPWPFEVQTHILSFCVQSPWPWKIDDTLLYGLGQKLAERLPSPGSRVAKKPEVAEIATPLEASSVDKSKSTEQQSLLTNKNQLSQFLSSLLPSVFAAIPLTQTQTQAKYDQKNTSTVKELPQANDQESEALANLSDRPTVTSDVDSRPSSLSHSSSERDGSFCEHTEPEHHVTNEPNATYTGAGIGASWWANQKQQPWNAPSLDQMKR